MSLGGGQNTHTEEPKVLSLRVNQSAYGTAKARVWGKARVPGNMLWYGNFTAIPHTDTQTTGGKGAPKSSTSTTSYTYTAAFVLGLATGQIAGVGKVWMNKSVTDINALGMTFKSGQLRQAAWAYLVSNVPDQAVTYSGIAYVAASSFDLGTSSDQPNLSFEVFGERIIPGADDARPSDVITDIVSDSLNGLGLSGVLGDMADYSAWCAAMGLTVSVAATSQRAARDYLKELLSATLAEPVWSNGQLKLVPYGDEPVGTWTPNTTPVYDVTESDLLEAPVERRKQPSEATNRITLNFTSRAKDYNTSTVTRDDLSSVTQYGAISETLELHCISREEMAATVAEFWRDRELYIRNQWELRVDEHLCLLEPMDLMTLTFAPKRLDRVPVRVVEVDDDGKGAITLTVEEWPFGLLKPTAVPTQTPTPFIPQQQVAPGAANAPVIFQAPNVMTAPNLEVWIGTSGGADWGGANVWVSDDNQTYQQVGVIAGPARHGVLSTALPSGSDPDTGHTAYLDMSVSHGQLLSASQAAADNGDTLYWLGGEVMSYGTSTLEATDRYALTYLRRGLKGTAIASHATGTQFLRLDRAVFQYVVPKERLGRPIWIKLQSFNKYGASVEPLSNVTPYQYTLTGNKPNGLTSLAATGGLFSNDIAWTFVANQPDRDYTEVWGGTVNDRSQAFLLTSQKNPAAKWKHPGLQPGQTWYYWARVIDTSGNASDFYPPSATGGIECAPSSDPSALLQQLTNAIGTPQLAAELAQPISQIPAESHLNALASLQVAIDDYKTAELVRWHDTVTKAIVATDPVTGSIQLLAEASIKTDVEARLSTVEQVADANKALLQSTVSQLTSTEQGLTSAQSQITQMAGQISQSASTVYVDSVVSGVTGTLTVEAANNAQALAQAAIQGALDAFNTQQAQMDVQASVAVAQQDIKTNADATKALVTAQSALVAVVNGNAAAFATQQSVLATQISAEITARQTLATRVGSAESAIVSEQQARVTADAAEASARQALDSRLGAAEAAIVTEQQTRASADEAEASAREMLDARVTSAEALISSEQTARASADSAEATARQALEARMSSAEAAISNEQTVRADRDNALASSIDTVSATANAKNKSFYQSAAPTATAVGDIWYNTASNNAPKRWDGSSWVDVSDGRIAANAAAISSEATTRASADSANATSISNVQARLDSGDFAAVKIQSSANASAIGGIQAKYTVQVQATQDGKYAAAGIALISGGGQQSTFSVLADRFLVYRPDGSGSPQQVMAMGYVNGAYTLGLSGNLIIDGSIVGRSLTAGSVTADKMNVIRLSAVSGDLGTITAGIAQNASGSNYVNFSASGSAPFIRVGNNISLNADGTGYFSRTVISAPNIVASGTVAVSSGQVGYVNNVNQDGSVTGGYVGYDYLIDTGIQVSDSWSQAATDMYLASVTICAGYSINGGCNGYSSADIVVGDGLINGGANSPIDNRLYIKYHWGAMGPNTGQIVIGGLAWKVVKV